MSHGPQPRRLAGAVVAVLLAASCRGGGPAAAPAATRTITVAGHAATETGNGTTAIVLVHGASTHKDSWYPLMPALASAGYTALALDLGSDRAGAVQAAVTYVRAHGSRTVVLMGSSLGAQNALDASQHGDYAAVVTFSAVTAVTTHLPVLAIASRDDPTADTVSIAHQIVAGSGTGSETFVVTGSTHGVALVPKHPEAVKELLRWLHGELLAH